MLTDRAEALDDDPCPRQRQPDMLPRDIDRDRKAKAGSADLVEWDAADLSRQPDSTARLVLDPSHRQLVGSHIGPRDVIREIADRRGEGADQALLVLERHLGIGEDHRFAAAVRQSGNGILEGHRPRQPEGFLGADIGRHAHAADRRPAGDVVDRDDRLETDGGPVNVDELQAAQLIGQAKRFLPGWFIGSAAKESTTRRH